MGQAVRKRQGAGPALNLNLGRRLQEAAFILLGIAAVILALALWTFSVQDPGWSHTSGSSVVTNQVGLIGAYVSDILLYCFGYSAYLLPLILLFIGWRILKRTDDTPAADYYHVGMRSVGLILTVLTASALVWLRMQGRAELPHATGGVMGDVVGSTLLAALGTVGGPLVLLALLLVGITLLTGLSWVWLMDRIGAWTLRGLDLLAAAYENLTDWNAGRIAKQAREAVVKVEKEKKVARSRPRIEPQISTFEPSRRAVRERQETLFEKPASAAELPPLSLLDDPPPAKGGYSEETLEAMSRQVELKLADFGVEAQVVAVHPGPVITRFELQPAAGVKVSRITNLAKDLARSLSVVSVRVVEVIPGKSTVGLEIPNTKREVVTLSEMLSAREYEASTSPLTLALGKDIGGKPVVVDLARMPHLLVAGTTGSGKSVALNAMILSLLYKSTPSDIRLIMIDPKMLELSVYEGIPVLLAPVVTDMKEAANALRWCVNEMERRYRLMAALGVRNIGGYNRKVQDAIEAGKPLVDPLVRASGAEEEETPTLDALPYVVVIVDELADMMMTVGKKVEELIARLAQKARAAGIHLILATQRPSVDVITGLIKANIPSRIAFQVSSRVDSRTILDQMGAETLLGHGDMLYLPPGVGLPTRVHGAFVSDQEVHQVVAHLKASGTPEYIDAIVRGDLDEDLAGNGGYGEANGTGEDVDVLYDEAVRFVTETRRASVSAVQRRLKIGYNRAARMVEEMERAGVVGSLQSNGTREVLAPPPPKD
ncbi:MAG: DNA translocase FtsK [Gammaproteobacteria bacterium]|nr:DNA translocase FtsK [Gammaproteobacteria bacterium]